MYIWLISDIAKYIKAYKVLIWDFRGTSRFIENYTGVPVLTTTTSVASGLALLGARFAYRHGLFHHMANQVEPMLRMCN